MDSRDYIKTLHINSLSIDLGIDDYGQCYYIEWEQDGEKKITGMGAYNFHYMEDIYYMFDPIYKSLARKELWGEEMTEEEKAQWQKYQKIFKEEDDEC